MTRNMVVAPASAESVPDLAGAAAAPAAVVLALMMVAGVATVGYLV
jgi:hypothetical protein